MDFFNYDKKELWQKIKRFEALNNNFPKRDQSRDRSTPFAGECINFLLLYQDNGIE